MNRTLLPTQDVSPPFSSKCKLDWLGVCEQPTVRSLSDVGVPYCLFAPIHYEHRYSYPLVVWLHGPTSNEQELRKAMPLISVRNYVAVAPRGTVRIDGVRGAFGWDQSVDEIAEADQRVRDCLEVARERFNIHPERIYLAGFAEGGTMALRLGLEHPDRFAGAISLGGPVPSGGRPLKRFNHARKLPLLLSVSPDQASYSLEQVMDNVRLLHSAGSSLSLRLYPEGDELTTIMLSDVDDWIMAGVCPAPVLTS